MGRNPFEPACTNYIAVNRIESGSGTLGTDASPLAFGADSLLFFVPYQHIRFAPDASVYGEVVPFHAHFRCVETFHAEVGCSGLLFNDPYGIPVVVMDERAKTDVKHLIDHIRKEHEERNLAYGEVVLAQSTFADDGAARASSGHGGLVAHELVPRVGLSVFRSSLNRMRLPNGSMTSAAVPDAGGEEFIEGHRLLRFRSTGVNQAGTWPEVP
jgi:hypothetical protein